MLRGYKFHKVYDYIYKTISLKRDRKKGHKTKSVPPTTMQNKIALNQLHCWKFMVWMAVGMKINNDKKKIIIQWFSYLSIGMDLIHQIHTRIKKSRNSFAFLLRIEWKLYNLRQFMTFPYGRWYIQRGKRTLVKENIIVHW